MITLGAGCVVQVVNEGGVYANGQVVVQPLPTAIYGDDSQRTIPLRRWEAVLTEEELEEQCAKEMQKVQDTPCAFWLGCHYVLITVDTYIFLEAVVPALQGAVRWPELRY